MMLCFATTTYHASAKKSSCNHRRRWRPAPCQAARIARLICKCLASHIHSFTQTRTLIPRARSSRVRNVLCLLPRSSPRGVPRSGRDSCMHSCTAPRTSLASVTESQSAPRASTDSLALRELSDLACSLTVGNALADECRLHPSARPSRSRLPDPWLLTVTQSRSICHVYFKCLHSVYRRSI